MSHCLIMHTLQDQQKISSIKGHGVCTFDGLVLGWMALLLHSDSHTTLLLLRPDSPVSHRRCKQQQRGLRPPRVKQENGYQTSDVICIDSTKGLGCDLQKTGKKICAVVIHERLKPP